MARGAGTVVENNFVNGLVTEATGMNFPENACVSATNVVFKETGEATRRYGYDYETAYQLNSITRSNSAIVEFEWKSAGGDGDVNFVVQQIGSTLYFYRVSATDPLSAGLHATTISLSTFAVPGAPSTDSILCSFSSGKGYLFVTNKYCEPFYVSYTASTNALAATEIDLKIRDFEGVEDGLDVRERPTTAQGLSALHRYNLYNQGWFKKVRSGAGTQVFPITTWNTDWTNYPSNADIWWTAKDATGDFIPANITGQQHVGQSLAPKGYFILDAFNQDRTATMEALNDESATIPAITAVTSSYFRPSATAFFAGRVWYAGVNYQNFSNLLYYSQIIERDSQLGSCYQNLDPTGEEFSDLLDTDGGVAKILDMGTVVKLFATQKALLVFASNGVWSISGSDVTPFKATDYTIVKISSVSVTSSLSFVDALGSPIFWTEDGIWTLASEGGAFTIVSISDKKIKQYFKAIPRDSKKYAKGAFNVTDRLVQWVFSSTAPTTVEGQFNYDSILTLNTTTGAFYPWTIYSATKTISGIISCLGPTYGSYDTVIDSNSDTVIDGSSNTVIVSTSSDSSNFRYFTTKNVSGTTYNSTWSVAGNTAYLDWVADSESYDYTSSFTSGYRIHADANREYQANYVTFYCTDATSSSAFVQGLWDFSNNTLSKKWTTAQQIYNSTPTYRSYRIRKIKIRGWGKSLNFKVYGATGAPLNIVGWSAFETSNPLP